MENPWGPPKVAVKGLYKLTIQPKKNFFFISLKYAILTKSTSLIPNMKTVFFLSRTVSEIQGPPALKFLLLNLLPTAKWGATFSVLIKFLSR